MSEPAVTAEPEPMRLPASTMAPEPLVTGTTAGVAASDMPGTIGGWNGDDFLPAFTSPAGLRRTIRRWPGSIPRIAIGRQQVENDARHRRFLLILIDADREDVFFLNGDPLLGQSQTRVGKIDDQPRRRIESSVFQE